MRHCLGYHFSCHNRGQDESDFNRVACSSLIQESIQSSPGLCRAPQAQGMRYLTYDTLASSTCRFFVLMVLDGCSSSFHHVHIPANRNGEEEMLKGRTCLFLLKPQQRSSTQTYCSHVIGQNLVKQPSSPWEPRKWSLLARKPCSGVNLRNSITNEGGK